MRSSTRADTEPVAGEAAGPAAAPLRDPALTATLSRARREPPGEPSRIGYLYVLPALAVYGAFVLYPLLETVWYSLYEWDGLSESTFVGLDNYREVVTSDPLRSAYGHAFVLILFYAVIPVGLALVLVAAISRGRVRGQAGFRTILFLPQVIPMVVVAVIWRMIYAPSDGSLNEFLGAIGLDSLQRAWLGDFALALPAVGVVGTWVMSGLALVLFIAGVQRIPQSLYDAARVDGAGPVREFFAVTLPNLRGEIAVALTLMTIAALRNFDLVYVTTQGGPGNSTSVPAFEVYNRAFQTSQVGSAAAIGFTLAVMIFAITFAITRIAERERP